MTIKLKPEHVGRKVELRCGMQGVIHSYHPTSDKPFRIDLDPTKVYHNAVFYKEDGKQWDIETGHDVVKILEEEKEMEVKVRYFTYDDFMYIQNVKESNIIIINTWKDEIISVMNYSSPIKAKEQMYTYATLLEVEEVKSH